MDNKTDISENPNNITSNVITKTLVHEKSPTEYYVGISISGSEQQSSIWSIRRIMKTDDVWEVSTYPDGDQDFKCVWYNRFVYDYK